MVAVCFVVECVRSYVGVYVIGNGDVYLMMTGVRRDFVFAL